MTTTGNNAGFLLKTYSSKAAAAREAGQKQAMKKAARAS